MKPFDDADHGYEVTDIPISLIDRYPDHPFYVDDDDDMLDLAPSIEAVGQLTPASVRPKKNGRYELLSGGCSMTYVFRHSISEGRRLWKRML